MMKRRWGRAVCKFAHKAVRIEHFTVKTELSIAALLTSRERKDQAVVADIGGVVTQPIHDLTLTALAAPIPSRRNRHLIASVFGIDSR
ncbi:MAG: hypothetical protein Q7N50_09970 [Armatimonadota bacterium]|nr:hypothetical protein [Armatimonadota bacterium]